MLPAELSVRLNGNGVILGPELEGVVVNPKAVGAGVDGNGAKPDGVVVEVVGLTTVSFLTN